MLRKILLVAATPHDEVEMKVDEEWEVIQQSLASGRHTWTIESKSHCQVHQLAPVLQQTDPTILHISCHGWIEGLILENSIGESFDVYAEHLAIIL